MNSKGIQRMAYYTGEVWCRHGLSIAALGTAQGRFLYRALEPFEQLGCRLIGGCVRNSLLQRHQIIDVLLDRYIEQEGISQVIEIGAGFSGRGVRYAQKYPGLIYVDMDLPDLVAVKRNLLSTLCHYPENYILKAGDIWETSGDSTFEQMMRDSFDQSHGVVVLSEGVMNYFDLEAVTRFWNRLADCLRVYPTFHYLTDLYTGLSVHPHSKLLSFLQAALARFSGSAFQFHFQSDDEIAAHFRKLGFLVQNIWDPATCYVEMGLRKPTVMPIVRVLDIAG